MRNHEVTARQPLLDDRGGLREPGWARTPVFYYDRAVLDDGTALELRDMLCFAEKVHNRY